MMNPTSVEREPEDIYALNLLHYAAVIAAAAVVWLFKTCIYGPVSMHVGARCQHQVSSRPLSTLRFEAGSLIKPVAHQFMKTWDPPVPAVLGLHMWITMTGLYVSTRVPTQVSFL